MASSAKAKKTSFSYRTQPTLALNSEQLNGHNRTIKFSFKVNKQGDVKKVRIKKGSGIFALDQMLVQAVSNVQVDVQRQYWIYKKSTLKDEITFDLDQCD